MAGQYLEHYYPVFLFFAIAIGLSAAILIGSRLVVKQRPYAQKLSPYECGFPPASPMLNRFDIRYYLIAILFILFDLEVTFLFPWAISLKNIGVWGFWSMMIFLSILTFGFIYEWKKGALEWE